MLVEPLSNADVKKLILSILDNGHLNFTNHARDELANDGMNIDDARLEEHIAIVFNVGIAWLLLLFVQKSTAL